MHGTTGSGSKSTKALMPKNITEKTEGRHLVVVKLD